LTTIPCGRFEGPSFVIIVVSTTFYWMQLNQRDVSKNYHTQRPWELSALGQELHLISPTNRCVLLAVQKPYLVPQFPIPNHLLSAQDQQIHPFSQFISKVYCEVFQSRGFYLGQNLCSSVAE